MSHSGESFTLLESGTSRLHFKLVKALEDASSADEQDLIIVQTVAQLRTQLTSGPFTSDVTRLASALLTLLHCLHHYPSSAASVSESATPFDLTFSLVPTLRLLSLATDWRHLLLAYQLLPFLLPPPQRDHPLSRTGKTKPVNIIAEADDHDLIDTSSQASATTSTSSQPPSSIARDPPSHRSSFSKSDRGTRSEATVLTPQGTDDSSSLLLLNTFRASLSAAAAEQTQAGSYESDSERSSRSQSRSSSASRSPLRVKRTGHPTPNPSSVKIQSRALASLRSLAAGTPHGPAVLPSLASTLVSLTRHPDCTIRSMTLNAMLSCASVPADDPTDRGSQLEMLEAALTIVRLTLASTFAFSPGSDLEEQHGIILSEMERRVDSNPTVLRSCMRVVEHARTAGMISDQEAACHAAEALQASRWAPMHLDLPALQQSRIAAPVIARTEGIRARVAARQRPSLHVKHDYHGSYAPWLVEACLSILTKAIECMSEQSSVQIEQVTRMELSKMALRIYSVASQGKAAALALCISAARCIGALHRNARKLYRANADGDGETSALWTMLSTHTKSQLRSSNPNRKTAGLLLLEALLPLGWAQSAAEVKAEPSQGDAAVLYSPLQISEAEMGLLMALLADADSSIRKRALALLHQVDASLTLLLRTQLQSAVDAELLAKSSANELYPRGDAAESVIELGRRLLEVALFAVSASEDDAAHPVEPAGEAASALERAVVSGIALNLFGSVERKSTVQDGAWMAAFFLGIASLPIKVRLVLLQSLTRAKLSTEAVIDTPSGLYLLCCLLCDLNEKDLRSAEEAAGKYLRWVETELLGMSGLSGVLVRLSRDQQGSAAAREAVLGVTAKTISLATKVAGHGQASAGLATVLDTLQSTVSKLMETESNAALRTEAINLRLICQTLLHPAAQPDSSAVTRIYALASSCHTIQDSVKALLKFQLGDRTAPEANDGKKGSAVTPGSSILATASLLFSSTSRPPSRFAAPSDNLSGTQLHQELTESVLQSSRLLSPSGSTTTLRSGKRDASAASSRLQERATSNIRGLYDSAIPSESKRLRDQSIAQAMSESIANLVLGSDAKTQNAENEVIFSATSSGILEGDELDLIDEVVDPGRLLQVTSAAEQEPSLLDLVHQCHNHDPWLDASLTPFVLDGVQIGFLPARVAKACIDDSTSQRRAGGVAVLRKVRFAMHHREILPVSASSRVCEAITFTADFATPEARTAGLNAVVRRWRDARIFPDPLDGWRDELYAIYGLKPRPGTRNPIAFKLERSACALFGFATFGVHLTAYTVSPDTGDLKVWVPQRSSTKSTWPGYLDNSVAGGIVAGDLPMESMVRECEEEASLGPSIVEKYIKQTGVLSYCYKTLKQGWIQPEVEYVYDLPLPADVTLQPKDGEVDHFELMTLDEIYDKMRQGKFKANCVLVLLDFLIRHGHITADREPGYCQIVAQLHVDLRLPGP